MLDQARANLGLGSLDSTQLADVSPHIYLFIHFYSFIQKKATLWQIESKRFPEPSVSLDDAKICGTLPDNDLWNGQAGSIKGKRIFVWGQP